MGDETAQPGQPAPGLPDGPPAAGPDPAADPTSEADEATPSEPAIPSPDHPRRRALRPPEALEWLDRQWESQEPGLDRSVPPVALLELHTRLSERLRTIYVDAIVREAQAALALAEAIVAANTGAIEAFARVFATTDELSGPALHAAIAAAGFRDASGRPIAPGLGPDVHAA